MRRLTLILLTVLFFGIRALHAAFEFRDPGARAASLSGAYTAMAQDSLAPLWNPAAARAVSYKEITSLYSQIFSMRELSQMGFSGIFPTRRGSFGFAFSQFGSKTYQEQEVSVSHGFKVAKNILAGYSVKVLSLKMDMFGSKSRFSSDGGFFYSVTENLDLALMFRNINEPSFGASAEKIPRTAVLGASFMPFNGVKFSADIIRESSREIRVKSGMEFGLSKNFILRGGLQNSLSRFSGGLGFRQGNVSLDYAYLHNSYLPGSHIMSLTYRWGEQTDNFVVESARLKTKKAKERKRFNFLKKINLADATFEDLDDIPGIGPLTAQKIIDYRDQIGIQSSDDLLKIPGMTKKVFLILDDCCAVQPPAK